MACFGPAELDGGVRPPIHLQVHLLGLDHIPAGREDAASDKWMGNILQMRKEAVPFLESLGIPKPRSKAEWSYIFKEMGTFLAAKNFIGNCPLPVMELPVAPVHDSKEALRFRAVCDITLGKWWARRSSRPPGPTCAGSARASGRAVGGPGCSRLKDKATCLQLVMDEPPSSYIISGSGTGWTRRTKWYQRTTSTAWWRRRRAGFPSLCPRGTYGSSSWRLRTASSARTFRMSGTARTEVVLAR